MMQAIVRAQLEMPFRWGVFDCATLFADPLLAATGRDPLKGLRGYPAAASALLALRNHGYRSVRDLVIDRFDAVDPSDARDGDVGYPRPDYIEDRLVSPLILLGPHGFTRSESGPVARCRSVLFEVYRWRS